MPIGNNATESPRASFRGGSPRLAAAQPPNQTSGDFYALPNRPLSMEAPSLDLILDQLGADELEREIVHLVRRVDGLRSALRVAGAFELGHKIERGFGG